MIFEMIWMICVLRAGKFKVKYKTNVRMKRVEKVKGNKGAISFDVRM